MKEKRLREIKRLGVLHKRVLKTGMAALIVGAVSAPALADDDLQRGPVPLQNMRSALLLFAQFTPEAPDLVPVGRWRLRTQFDVANNLLAPRPGLGSTVVEDHEVQRFTLAYRAGLSRTSEFGIRVPILARNGGFLDEVLSWWHRVWGLPQNGPDNPAGRESFPRNASVWNVTDSLGSRLSGRTAFGLGDVTFQIKHALGESTQRAAASVRLLVKLPTGSARQLLGSGGADVGIGLDVRHTLGRNITLYGGVAGAFLGPARTVRGARGSNTQAYGTLEYHPNSRDSYLFQIDAASTPLLTGNSFADRAQITGTFAYRRALSKAVSFTAAFSENGDFHAYQARGLANVGPDFTASLGLEWRR